MPRKQNPFARCSARFARAAARENRLPCPLGPRWNLVSGAELLRRLQLLELLNGGVELGRFPIHQPPMIVLVEKNGLASVFPARLWQPVAQNNRRRVELVPVILEADLSARKNFAYCCHGSCFAAPPL